MKLKSHVLEGYNIDDSVKVEEDVTEVFLTTLEDHIGDIDALGLFQECREVSDHIAGYITRISRKICADCFEVELISKDTANAEGDYVSVLSRGGLLISLPGLSDAVAREVAMLVASPDVTCRSKVLPRKAVHSVWKKFLNFDPLGCKAQEPKISSTLHGYLTNIFFKNERKPKADAVTKDNVTAFKKYKHEK